MQRNVRYFGLTLHQLGRMAACWQLQSARHRPFSIDDIAEACDIDHTQAARFAREMVRLQLLVSVPGNGRYRLYLVTSRWRMICDKLERLNRLPGVCCVCGKPSVAFPFCRRFFCEDCLMIAHRDDFKSDGVNGKRYNGEPDDTTGVIEWRVDAQGSGGGWRVRLRGAVATRVVSTTCERDPPDATTSDD